MLNTELSPRPLTRNEKLILSVVRCTPLKRGRARRFILSRLKRQMSGPVIADFRGVPFILNLDNTTEAKALFGHYNLEELAFLKRAIAGVDAPVFVDLGANSGFYTQNFLYMAPDAARALAIEPNPSMCARIRANEDHLRRTCPDKRATFTLEESAVGGEAGTVQLDLKDGYGAASVTTEQSATTLAVPMDRLDHILKRHGVAQVTVMKVDIEGYEDRALIPFFEQADPALFPRHIIIEHTSAGEWAGDLFAVLEKCGYREAERTRGNMMLSRS